MSKEDWQLSFPAKLRRAYNKKKYRILSSVSYMVFHISIKLLQTYIFAMDKSKCNKKKILVFISSQKNKHKNVLLFVVVKIIHYHLISIHI